MRLKDYLKFNNPPRFLATVGMANIVFYNGVYYYLLRTRRNFNLEKKFTDSEPTSPFDPVIITMDIFILDS